MKVPTPAAHRLPRTRKPATRPIPDSLRGELEDWNKTVEGELIFPNAIGTMYSRSSRLIRDFLKAGRAAAGAPHLPIAARHTASAKGLEPRLTGIVVTMPVRESA